LATILAVAAYHLSVLGAFFLLPLQWIRQRRGERPFFAASVLTMVGIGGVEAAVKLATHSLWTVLDAALLGLPLLLIVGWVSIVTMERLRWRFLYRLLTVTAVTGLVLFPLVAGLFGQEAFVQVVEKSFDEVWNQVLQTPGFDVPGVMGQLNKTEFFELLKETFLGSFLLVFFLFWGFTARMSQALAPRREPRTWKDFVVPSQGVWILLGLWGLILIQGLLVRFGMKGDWGIIQYAVLNAAWVALIVYGMVGWGILHSLMDRWRWPRWGQGAVRVLLVCLVLLPGPGQGIVLVGLPVLAVLELWVNFRKRTQGVGL
jgi:hypothetical protein